MATVTVTEEPQTTADVAVQAAEQEKTMIETFITDLKAERRRLTARAEKIQTGMARCQAEMEGVREQIKVIDRLLGDRDEPAQRVGRVIDDCRLSVIGVTPQGEQFEIDPQLERQIIRTIIAGNKGGCILGGGR